MNATTERVETTERERAAAALARQRQFMTEDFGERIVSLVLDDSAVLDFVMDIRDGVEISAASAAHYVAWHHRQNPTATTAEAYEGARKRITSGYRAKV